MLGGLLVGYVLNVLPVEEKTARLVTLAVQVTTK